MNPRQVVEYRGQMSGGALPAGFNGTNGNTGTVVNMGDFFQRRGYTPMTANSAQQTAMSNENKSYQMWTTEQAKVYYPSAPTEFQMLARDYATSQLGHTKSNPATWQSYYNKAVDAAANESLNMPGDPISVIDFMSRAVQRYMDQGGTLDYGGGGSGGGGGGGGGYSGPVTNTQVALASESDAEALVDQALNTYLGRQATDGERVNFWKQLNKAQAANPTVTTTTPGGPGQSSTVQTGGVNEQQAAQEFAMSRDNAAEFAVETQYMDWLVEKMSTDPTEGIASGL